MEILDRSLVEIYGRYKVFGGDVMTSECGEVTFCWVEVDGVRVSEFGYIDDAMNFARGCCEYEAELATRRDPDCDD